MRVSPQNGGGLPISVGGDHRQHPGKHDPTTLGGQFGPDPAQNFLQFGCFSPVSRPDPSSLVWGSSGGSQGTPLAPGPSCRAVPTLSPWPIPRSCPQGADQLGLEKKKKKEKKGLLRLRTQGQLRGRRSGAGPFPRRAAEMQSPATPPTPPACKTHPRVGKQPGVSKLCGKRGREDTPGGPHLPA